MLKVKMYNLKYFKKGRSSLIKYELMPLARLLENPYLPTMLFRAVCFELEQGGSKTCWCSPY